MHLHQAPLSLRTAHRLADAAAWAVALFRPLSTYTEEQHPGHSPMDEAGNCIEVTERCVFVQELTGASPWRFDLWSDRDESPEGCVNLRAFGCSIEVFYLRKGRTAPFQAS